MEWARLHLRGGRSIHINSPFVKTSTTRIEKVGSRDATIIPQGEVRSSSLSPNRTVAQPEGGADEEHRMQDVELRRTININSEEVAGTMTVSHLPSAEGIQHGQVVVYQANLVMEPTSHSQAGWIYVSHKKNVGWGHRDPGHQREGCGVQRTILPRSSRATNGDAFQIML
jgi:hypothetical protein